MDSMQIAAVALALVALVLYRQLKTRIATDRGLLYLAAALIAFGLFSGGVFDTRDLLLSVALLVVEVAAAIALGVMRARTVRVWRDEAGVPWSRGTAWTLLGWLFSVAARTALLFAGHALGLAFAPTAALLFAGLTIGTQSLFVAHRARALPAPASTAPAGPVHR